MEDIYKRFHGVAGQANDSRLVGVVCAHKIDLTTVRVLGFSNVHFASAIDDHAQSEEEKKELEEVISDKLRVRALRTCSWYSHAVVTPRSTSATDRQSCLAVVEQLVTNRIQTSWADNEIAEEHGLHKLEALVAQASQMQLNSCTTFGVKN
jgi:hypothetical protein